MEKIIFTVFLVIGYAHKLISSLQMRKRKKIKGEIYHNWISKPIYAFYSLAYVLPLIELYVVKRTINYYISILFFIFYILGWILSYWARRTLDKYWTTEIEIREIHPLIKTGPYKFLRHPHYLFLLTEIYSAPLIVNTYYSIIILSIVLVPFIFLRLGFEEKELINKFGEEYKKYKREVWALFPLPLFKTGIEKTN